MQAAITTTGGTNLRKVDKLGVNLELRKYKSPNGAISFPALFEIPVDQRIAAMAQRDLGNTVLTITVALTLAFETMNLSRPMTSTQILDLAETIVDSAAEEDKPALEDLMLFLQRLTRGEYPGLFEGIDIPKFMERWNKYRDERWEEGVRLRDERHEQYKKLGDSEIFDRSYRKPETPFDEHMQSYTKKIQAKNDEIKELRAERKRDRK